MKYCIPYYRTSSYKDTIDEVTVLVTEKEELSGIEGFMGTRSADQRIFFIFRNLDYQLDDTDFLLLSAILKDKNYTICFESPQENYNRVIIDKCKKHNLNFCYSNAAYTYDVLYGLCDIGVTDVFISGDLGFDVMSLKRCKARFPNVIIRAFPDVCSGKWISFNPIYTFWIRPEDQDYYEGAIDVLHSWIGQQGPVQADAWYEIYAKEKAWYGDLQKLIKGLFVDDRRIDSRCFTKDWGNMRSNCGRDCLKQSQCTFCREAIKMAQNMKSLGYVFKEPEGEHSKLYYALMDEFNAKSNEQRAEIEKKLEELIKNLKNIEGGQEWINQLNSLKQKNKQQLEKPLI